MKRTIRRGTKKPRNKKTRNKKTRNKKTRNKNNRKLKSKAIKHYSKKMRGGGDEKEFELKPPISIKLGKFSKRLGKIGPLTYSPYFTLKINKIYIEPVNQYTYIDLNFSLDWEGTDYLGRKHENNIDNVNFNYAVLNSPILEIYLFNRHMNLTPVQSIESYHFTLENGKSLTSIIKEKEINLDILEKIYTEIEKTIRENLELNKIIRPHIPSPEEEEEEEP